MTTTKAYQLATQAAEDAFEALNNSLISYMTDDIEPSPVMVSCKAVDTGTAALETMSQQITLLTKAERAELKLSLYRHFEYYFGEWVRVDCTNPDHNGHCDTTSSLFFGQLVDMGMLAGSTSVEYEEQAEQILLSMTDQSGYFPNDFFEIQMMTPGQLPPETSNVCIEIDEPYVGFSDGIAHLKSVLLFADEGTTSELVDGTVTLKGLNFAISLDDIGVYLNVDITPSGKVKLDRTSLVNQYA